jgi:aldose 1-epimerase
LGVHPPTGERFLLTNGSSTAEIGALAAVLLSVRIDGVDITEPTAADAMPSHGSGIVLAPWPNRVRDAVWQFDGSPQQLDVTDPELKNAIHGLLRNVAYRERARTESSVTLGAVIYPQHGWPFLLDTWVRYDLGTDGLTVTHGVENLSDRPAPYAVGSHPYFRIGAVPTEQLTLTITGDRWIELDANLNPVAEHPVEGTGYDFRAGRALGDVDLNTDFTGLTAGPDGAARLTAPDGATLTLWVDEAFGWLQTFTPRDFPRDGSPAMAVALEPMTAPADALNSGEGIRWLEPGESWQASWGVRYRAAGA